ncbi:MAG TPA: radical SAM protein [Steroidobacter sp.]|uniref:B12-binding domain-containing radical SAM protein n=1 Tax=Steroidobacter sp. TaxID=1978227 RepID=UPI002ED8EAB8
MSTRRHILLINPTITSRRSARFPLAVMSLAGALDGRYSTSIIDGNIDRDFIATTVRKITEEWVDAVGITVMGGPQLPTAIAVSSVIRERFPSVPIIWGGYYPTICATPSITSPYVDYVVRGQGEETLAELLEAICAGQRHELSAITGLTWKREDEVMHNQDRPFSAARLATMLPFDKLDNPTQYLSRTYLGRRTAGYQAAFGCRFRCTFCGVARMFNGKTALPSDARLQQDLRFLKQQLGVDAIQFYDHNFFDREVDMVPLLEILAKYQLPWWCFARSDALLNLSERSWGLVGKSRLRMAYIGAESPSDWLLHDIRKGTRRDQTLEVVERCRSQGVIPELSFMLAPPQDPEGETEKTFDFIRRIKRMHPATEIMLYIYTPLPPGHSTRQVASRAALDIRGRDGRPLEFPVTADDWARPEWVDYWCHKDAPWLTEKLRRRILDFTTVLGCRFPTVTDIRSPPWAKSTLRALASWRYRYQKYHRPWELDLSKKLVRLRDPRASSL